jgi:hypothetical protein
MADKPPLSINYDTGTIQGPSAVMSRLFATPEDQELGLAAGGYDCH